MNIIGYWLKNKTKLNDSYIPVILSIISVVMATVYTVGTQQLNVTAVFTGIVQGVLVSASAIYTNQLYKQFKKGG